MIVTLLATLFAAAPAASAPAAGAPSAVQTVEAQGEAAIVNGDRGAAIEQAREAALREAVTQVAGTLVSGTTLTEGNILVSDRILSHTQGYVKHWAYVGEPVVEGGSVTVKVRCEVGTAELDKDLAAVQAILGRKGKPRVVMLVAEQNVGMTEPFAWWNKGQKEAKGEMVAVDLGSFENSFIETLQHNGWVFVDHGVISGKISTQHGFTTDLSVGGARELAKLGDAEVAIVGRVVAQSPGQSDLAPGMFAASANVSLRAINCDNGEIIDTISTTVSDITTLDASAQNAGEKALRLAAAQTARRLQQKILERWQGELGGSARVTMKVSGIKDYRSLQDFEGMLGSSVRGVRSVEERSADGSEAQLDLDVTGSSKMLAKQLSGKTVKGQSINVKHVSANEVDISLGK
jgi:hypothetical protein